MRVESAFLSPPGRCGYLPEQTWSLRYEVVSELAADEFGGLLQLGWRRFGSALFRPECADSSLRRINGRVTRGIYGRSVRPEE